MKRMTPLLKPSPLRGDVVPRPTLDLEHASKIVVTVTLNPSIDKTLLLPSFRPQRVIRVERVFIYPSGKGVNVARTLIRLGSFALCLGFIAGHFGASLQEALTREAIPHDFTPIRGETRINITLRSLRGDLETHLVEPGTPVTPSDLDRFIKTFQNHLQKAHWVALCGSLPPSAPPDFYAQLIRIAHRHQVPCALDTSGSALQEGLKAVPTLLKPNKTELEKALKTPLRKENDILNALPLLHRLGIRYIVVSLGRRGAIGSDGEGVWKATPPTVSVVNTIGSGDALLGGLLHALLKERPFPDALTLAVATGTANTLVDGPGYVDPEAVKGILKGVKTRRIR